MKIYSFVLVAFFFANALQGQKNTQKGLLALSQANFGVAKSSFYKELEKDSLSAVFGLSNYYLQTYTLQLDSAFFYLQLCSTKWSEAGSKKRAALQKHIPISDTTIFNLTKQLAYEELSVATKAASIPGLEKVLSRYALQFSALRVQATLFRDSIAFEQAFDAQSASAMHAFLLSYPIAQQQIEAQAIYDKLCYLEKTAPNTETALFSFIQDFSTNPYIPEAWLRLYGLHTASQSAAVFNSFIAKYPNAPQVSLAWKQIYRLFIQPYSVDKLQQFKLEYPAYPFAEDLAQDGELLLKSLFPFLQNERYGYMDANGQIVIAAAYLEASAFYEGTAIVSKDKQFALINKKNEIISANWYLDISKNHDGFIAEDSLGYYLLSNQGLLLNPTPMPWEELQQTLDALSWTTQTLTSVPQALYVVVKENGKEVLLKNGRRILSSSYDHIFYEDGAAFVLVKNGKALQYFDTTAKRLEINGLEWFLNAPELAVFSKDGYAVFSKKAKLGLMNKKGQIIIKNTFDAAQSVFGGLWPVEQNGTWGLINLSSKVILPFQYENIIPFKPFGFLVETKEGLGLVDTTGKFILNAQFQMIKQFEEGYFLVENQDGLGLFNQDGAVVINCAYQRIVRHDQNTLQLSLANSLSYYLIAEQKLVNLKP